MRATRTWLMAALLLALPVLAACGDDDDAAPLRGGTPTGTPSLTAGTSAAATPSPDGNPAATGFALSAPAFANNADIPVEYSCDGKSSSPQLAWSAPPAGTKSLALVMHDLDAGRSGGFTHWVLYNIPGEVSGLDAGASPGGALPEGTVQGANGSGRNSYTGPCPPKGASPHHYNFTLYALDTKLTLPAGKSKSDVEQAIQGHVLAQATLTGLFGH
jgi:Raf kinase inhibitor-like YbhB/YbcL family protein